MIDTTMPKQAVWAAAIALVLLAAFGAYQGVRRGAADLDAASASDLALTAPSVAGARQASALVDSPAGLTEAQVREIARQEARAALGKSDAPASSSSSSTTPTASTAQASSGGAPAAGSSANGAATTPARPAATAPAPPPPAQSEGSNPAPLF